LPFSIKRIEAVFQIAEKLVAQLIIVLTSAELGVVGVE
jgi:hypothetical protein